MTAAQIAAIVLAGGRSRRFGSDKLAAPLGERTLLESAISELPADWLVVLVGPDRELSAAVIEKRRLTWVREDPPGGGPAAGLVAGIACAIEHGAQIVVTLPGDAPSGGRAAGALVAALGTDPAVVAIDADGREQPLQFAARIGALDRLAQRGNAAGMRARDLLPELGDYRRVRLDRRLTLDIDTPEDLARLSES